LTAITQSLLNVSLQNLTETKRDFPKTAVPPYINYFRQIQDGGGRCFEFYTNRNNLVSHEKLIHAIL